MATSSTLNSKLKDFEQWKISYLKQLQQYQRWLEAQTLYNEEVESVFNQCRQNLSHDKLRVIFIGEFSRGKTELINALFFADLGRRLLPSSAGRTTMCPVEILHDPSEPSPYLHLLPIESKMTEMSLENACLKPDDWIKIDLDLNNTIETEQKLGELVKTKKVGFEEAAKMGLLTGAISNKNQSKVEIPCWRHAVISFPHPLLEKGLVIFDTPGLNAIGNEPELTLKILPQAQAALFVLGADTGVSHSDLKMWDNHLKKTYQRDNQRLIVALNKIDTLWDDLSSKQNITRTIKKQCLDVAQILKIKPQYIFPLSAQKALISKVRKDPQLLVESRILDLEHHLSKYIVGERQNLISNSIIESTTNTINNIQAIVLQRKNKISERLEMISNLQTKSDAAIQLQLRKTLSEKEKYAKNLTEFKNCELELTVQSRRLRKLLNLKKLDNLLHDSHHKMLKNWTTGTMKGTMKKVFDDTQAKMIEVNDEVKRLRNMVRTIYRRFQTQHQFESIAPQMLSLMEQQIELDTLYQEAEIFRRSTRATLSEQHFVVQHFLETYVSQLKAIFKVSEEKVGRWLGTTLQPLAYQVRDHRYTLASQVRELKTAQTSRETIKVQITKLSKEEEKLKHQLSGLRSMLLNIQSQSDK